MPLPAIHTCLLCEEVRHEKGGKVSLLGVYGITPGVSILLKNQQDPVEKLFFVLWGGSGEGRFTLTAALVDEHDNPIIPSVELPPQSMNIPEGKVSLLALGIHKISFPHIGRYRFRLKADGRLYYETSFAVALGEEKDFA
jgi:hypothetical protein